MTSMEAPAELLAVWTRFADIPCETFTKGWWYSRCPRSERQRTIEELREHRRRFGTGGNCFDLTLWLVHELNDAGIPNRVIGRSLETYDAHVAVLVTDAHGREYLCDVGDVWLQPIAAVSDDDVHYGFAPGCAVRVHRDSHHLSIECRRSGGDPWFERYELANVSQRQLELASNHSQSLLRRPFCQMLRRHPRSRERELWHYDRDTEYFSLRTGREEQTPCSSREGWVRRIHAQSGIAREILVEGFAAYDRWSAPKPPRRSP